jgi:hypothetical protein
MGLTVKLDKRDSASGVTVLKLKRARDIFMRLELKWLNSFGNKEVNLN